MNQRYPKQIDMTPQGEFLDTPAPPLTARIARTAMVVAIVAGGLAALLLMLWFALALIPVAIGAASVAWLAFKVQMWRAGARGGFRRDLRGI